MGIIDKITGHSGSHDAHHESNKVAAGNSQPTGDLRTGTGGHRAEQDLSNARGDHTVQHAAPLRAEHVHDKYEHVDKTQKDVIKDRTQVEQTVQPVEDRQTQRTQHERVDHGTEVHEHGRGGLDRNAEAELARKREQIAAEHRSTHDEETRQTSMRPDVDVHHRKNVVEEVVPVVERDVVRPHQIEHNKRDVHIEHEAPTFEGTRVAEPVSINQYENKSGVKVHNFDGDDDKTKRDLTTQSHSHGGEHRIGHQGGVQEGLYENQRSTDGQRLGREGNYDNTRGAEYDNTRGTGVGSSTTTGTGTHEKRGLGEKIKDAVTGHHHN